MSEAFAELAGLYLDRTDTAEQLAARGIAVVGTVGVDIPAVLVQGAGAQAYRLHSGNSAPTAAATEHLGAADATIAEILDQILSGKLNFLRGILISHQNQATLRLFYVLRQLRAAGLECPPVHLVEITHLDREPSRRYSQTSIESAIAVVASWCGTTVDTRSLNTALRDNDLISELLHELNGLRSAAASTVSGLEMLHATATAAILPAADSYLMLTECVVAAGARATPTTARRVVVGGSGHDNDDAYRAIEYAGIHIAADDHDWALPGRNTELTSMPTATLSRTECLQRICAIAMFGHPVSTTTSLIDSPDRLVRRFHSGRADAVLMLIREHDEAPTWDLATQTKALAAQGIPLSVQHYISHRPTIGDVQQAVESVRAAERVGT